MQILTDLLLGFFVISIFSGYVFTIQLHCDRLKFSPDLLLRGLLAALGLGFIGINVVLYGSIKPLIVVVSFVFILMGALVLFGFMIRKKQLPALFLIIHPLFSLFGLLLLARYLIGQKFPGIVHALGSFL
ncbi:MAG: hypothetical protein NXI01_07135 [Gammaproteobacteria bacterium]|nr:hypothetical protein [Gammaproteobacteria bacterium]